MESRPDFHRPTLRPTLRLWRRRLSVASLFRSPQPSQRFGGCETLFLIFLDVRGIMHSRTPSKGSIVAKFRFDSPRRNLAALFYFTFTQLQQKREHHTTQIASCASSCSAL